MPLPHTATGSPVLLSVVSVPAVVPVASVVPLLVSVVSEPAVVVPALSPDELDPELCIVPVSLVPLPLEVAEQFSRSSR